MINACQRVSFTQSSTMPRRACSPCCCRPCTRAAQPLLLLPSGIWANTPLIPGLSDSPSRNPHYHPPSDGASAPFEADENEGWFLSLCLSLRLLVCFFPPALLLTTTRPASAMLVVSRRAIFMLRCPLCCRCCAAAAALPPLRCQSFQSCRILLSYSYPLE